MECGWSAELGYHEGDSHEEGEEGRRLHPQGAEDSERAVLLQA